MIKLHKLIKLAYKKGYRVTDDGRLIGLRGKERKITVPPSGTYPRFTIHAGKEFSKCGTYGIPVHMFASYCFYGDKMFEEGLEVRHLNADITDVSKKNIVLGTKQENEDDKSQETRKEVGRINSVKRKGKRSNNTRFNDEQIREIKQRIANGESNAEIARSYDIHRNNIRNIRIGETYKDIKI